MVHTEELDKAIITYDADVEKLVAGIEIHSVWDEKGFITHYEVISDVPVENVEVNVDTKNILHKKTENQKREVVESYFTKLTRVNLETKEIKKGNTKLNYASWSEVWQILKEQHPNANYEVYLTKDESPVFRAGTGGMIKIMVSIPEFENNELKRRIEHNVMMPILDNMHKGIKYEEITSFDVNKAIQRGLVKAIAMHGLGLFVFKGEENPEE